GGRVVRRLARLSDRRTDRRMHPDLGRTRSPELVARPEETTDAPSPAAHPRLPPPPTADWRRENGRVATRRRVRIRPDNRPDHGALERDRCTGTSSFPQTARSLRRGASITVWLSPSRSGPK